MAQATIVFCRSTETEFQDTVAVVTAIISEVTGVAAASRGQAVGGILVPVQLELKLIVSTYTNQQLRCGTAQQQLQLYHRSLDRAVGSESVIVHKYTK